MILCHGNASVCISKHPRIIDNKKQKQRYIHNRIPDGLQPSSNQEITQENCNEREDNGMLGNMNSHPLFHKSQAWEGLKHRG
jgi:hypothetical protein